MAKLNLTKLFASLSLLCFAGSVTAQMTGGSVFLKGKYVEAGICANGDFGASTPPAGYHPHTTSVPTTPLLLGFVADPGMDGWTVGTPNPYTGDFFTPGSPFEGWNIQIGSLQAQAQSCAGFGGGTGLTGANTAYTTSGSKITGTWVGTFAGLNVKQETTIDTLALYFSMRITLTNTTTAPINDIYYLRSLDPDNDESWGGSFSTLNKIEYQLPNASNSTVVSATGTVDASSYLALGTTDSNAKCLIYSAWPIVATTDLSTIFSGTYAGPGVVYTAGATSTGDVAIGLAFRVAHLAALDSASDSVSNKTTTAATKHKHPANEQSFTYFYAFRPDAVDSAIKALVDTGNTAVAPPDTTVTTLINNVNESSLVKVYPNPATSVLNITHLETTDQLMLFDMMGKAITQNWVINSGDVNTFSMQGIAKGSYILLVQDASGNMKARVPIRKL